MSDTTFKEVDALVESIAKKRAEIEVQEGMLKNLRNELSLLETRAMEQLDKLERKSYQSRFGNLQVATRYSFRFPTGDDKAQFINYMGREQFMNLATIHSQTFTSMCNSLFEDAKGRGDFEFKIPGVSEPVANRYVKLVKAKV